MVATTPMTCLSMTDAPCHRNGILFFRARDVSISLGLFVKTIAVTLVVIKRFFRHRNGLLSQDCLLEKIISFETKTSCHRKGVLFRLKQRIMFLIRPEKVDHVDNKPFGMEMVYSSGVVRESKLFQDKHRFCL